MLLIGITGLAGSGKDTAGAFLVERGWTRIGFADALKDLALRINPLVAWEDMEADWRLSDAIDTFGANEAKFRVPEVRRFYQALGNEAREVLGDTVWLEAWKRQAVQHDKVVVTDVRYPNEAEFIKSLGGRVVRIDRNGAGLAGAAGQHPSEVGVSQIDPWWFIDNNGTLEDLKYEVLDVVRWYEEARPWIAGNYSEAAA